MKLKINIRTIGFRWAGILYPWSKGGVMSYVHRRSIKGSFVNIILPFEKKSNHI